MRVRGVWLGLVLGLSLVAAPRAQAEPEGFNRAMLRFNRGVLRWVLEPSARGYNLFMPKWGQRRIVDFMANLDGPRDVVASLAQAKGRRAGIHTGRFLVNTTVGVAGLYDFAGHVLRWETSPETFDEAFGVWGIPTGTYLILPVMGEFSVRSLVGYTVDGVLNPIAWIPDAPPLVPSASAYTLRVVNLLATGMPAPRAPQGQWDAYEQSRFDFPEYERGRELFFQDQVDRVAD